jgi:tetratricopeptide (TPR) repeat protein
LDKALDISPEERAAWLDSIREQNPALATDLQTLLNEHRALGDEGFLRTGAAMRPTPGLLSGQTVGAYTLVSPIGQGGMGTVWLARRSDGRFEGRAAVKFLSVGLLGGAAEERFKREGSILARLGHPNIAHLIDAGVLGGGQPYLILEYVEGRHIDSYCREHALDIEARIHLFLDVLAAVAHAHANLIVHRDIKPSNVLVTDDGQVKLLDFGIAKLLEDEAVTAAATVLTREGERALTLAYAAPEQVSGNAVTTGTDIYALGVLLYLLLAGKHPAESALQSPADLMKAIVDTQPPRPSDVVAPTTNLRGVLRGDLDTIVSKALKKNAAQRYVSVTAFAEDLRRYLGHEPITARPDTLTYRAGKFVRRNRIAVALATVIFIATTAGVIGTLIQARRARAQRDVAMRESARALRAEQAAAQEAATARAINEFLQHDLLAQASANTQSKPGTRPDPDLKVRTALDRASASIAGKFNQQPLVEASIRNTIGQTYAELGLYSESQRQQEQALELQRRVLGEDHPDTLSTMSRLAALQVTLANVTLAEPLAVRVLEARRRVLGEDHPDTLASMFVLADLYRWQSKNAQAESLLLSILPWQQRVKGEAHPDTLDTQHLLGVVYGRQGKYAQSEPLLLQVLEARRRVQGEEHPDTLGTINDLVIQYQAMGKYAQGEALMLDLFKVRRRIQGEDHPDIFKMMYELAVLYMRQGKYAQAEPLFIKALEAGRRIKGEESAETLNMMSALGLVYVEEGKYVEAEPLLRQVNTARRRLFGAENPSTLNTLSTLAQLHQGRGEYDSAEAVLSGVLEVRRRILGPRHPSTLASVNDFGALFLMQGKYERAERMFDEAVTGRRRVLGDGHPDTLASMIGLGECYQKQRKYAQAEAMAREALTEYEKTKSESWRRYKAQSLLGEVLAGQEKFAEAEPILLLGYEGLIQRKTTIPAADRSAGKRAGQRILRLYQDWGQLEKAAVWRARLHARNL